MDQEKEKKPTTDSWSWGKILKHVVLPKPKGSPKAGKKEVGARIGMVAVILLVLMAFSSGEADLPSCGSQDAKSLVQEIVTGSPEFQAMNARFVELTEVREEGFNESEQLRTCEAVLVTNYGEDLIRYVLEWRDRSSGYFEAEVGFY